MFTWYFFFTALFWLSFFFFLFFCTNFFFLLLAAELNWLILYVLVALTSTILDDLTLISLTFFLLGFAAIELAIGLMLLTFLKYVQLSVNINVNTTSKAMNLFQTFVSLNKKKYVW